MGANRSVRVVRYSPLTASMPPVPSRSAGQPVDGPARDRPTDGPALVRHLSDARLGRTRDADEINRGLGTGTRQATILGMSGLVDHYSVLEVKPDAEAGAIRAAYRRLAWQYHPDVGGSQRAMAALNGAWHILRDPDARARYDGRRSAVSGGPMPPTPAARPAPAARPTPAGPPTAAHAAPMARPAPAAPATAAAHPTPAGHPTPAEPVSRGERRAPGAAASRDPAADLGAAASAKATRPAAGGPRNGPTVMDFGRYEGWSLVQLSTTDPDYLEWLARTSIGRRLQPEIAALLAPRHAAASTREEASRTRQSARAGSRWARARPAAAR